MKYNINYRDKMGRIQLLSKKFKIEQKPNMTLKKTDGVNNKTWNTKRKKRLKLKITI